jgi:hypothetical protein
MLAFGIGQPSSAQLRIHGTIVDEDNQGLSYVSVGIPGTKFGTLASTNGRFELMVDASMTESELCFHRMSYAPQCIPIRMISGELSIKMISQPIPMSEVTVTPRARINPTDVVIYAASEFQKRNNEMYVSTASYVEKATCGGRTCMFTEGLGYLVSFGRHSPIRLDKFSFLTENMRKSDRRPEWLDLTRHNAAGGQPSDMPPGYLYALNAVTRFEGGGPLNRPDRYRYEEVHSSDIPSDELHIAFRPKLGRRAFQGVLILDRSNWQIQRVELGKTEFYSSWMFRLVPASGRIDYEHVNNRIVMKSIGFTVPTDDVLVQIELHSGDPLDPGYAIQPSDFNVFTYYEQEPFVHYDERRWSHIDQPFNIDYDQIERELGMTDSLAEQFRKNSAQPFYYTLFADGRRLGVTGGEATYKTVNDHIAALNNLFGVGFR